MKSKAMRKSHFEAKFKSSQTISKISINSKVILEFVELSSNEDETLSLIARLIGAGDTLKEFSAREANALSIAIEDYLNKKKSVSTFS